MRTPDFFIVGAAKCGTTSLYRYLGRHPEVFMPSTKWINYFNVDLASSANCACWDDYLTHFADAGDARRVGEASESSLYSKRAAAGIRDACPGADIIIMLRNPVDVLHSLHSQLLFSGVEDIEDFAEALAAEPDRKRGERLPPVTHHPQEWLLYREAAQFAEQVERYLDVFGRDRVQVILFDDFRNDTAGVYADTLRFLGVDPGFQPDFDVHNANAAVRNRRLDGFMRRPPESVRRLVRAVLPATGLRRGIAGRLRRLNTTETPRPALDPALRAELQRELAPDIERLAELIGRDLGHWFGPVRERLRAA
jgi:hypothetical protein